MLTNYTRATRSAKERRNHAAETGGQARKQQVLRRQRLKCVAPWHIEGECAECSLLEM